MNDVAGGLDAVADLPNAIYKGIQGFGAYVLGAAGTFASLVAGALNDLWGTIKEVSNYFAQALFAAIQYLAYAFHQALTYIGNSIYSIGNWIYNTGADLAGSVISGITALMNWLVSHVNKMHTAITTAIGDVADMTSAHLAQFSSGIVDKLEKMLAVNLSMGVLSHAVDHGTLGWDTLKTMGGAFVLPFFLGPILRAVTLA
jgi:phage-related protein